MRELANKLGITTQQLYKQYKIEKSIGVKATEAMQNIILWLEVEEIYQSVDLSIWN